MNLISKSFAFILTMFFLVGCGVNIKEKNNCSPKVKYISTESIKFYLVEVLDPKFRYSDLTINKDERFLCVSTPNIINCDDSYGKLKITKLPIGTILQISGTAKRVEPFGFSTAFKNDMVYLKGIVNKTTVWFPLFQLSLFAEYESESALNTESNRVLGVNDSTLITNLDCFN